MGFYPKHLKRRLHRVRMNVILKAALAGCMFQPARSFSPTGDYTTYGFDKHAWITRWSVVYPDGQVSRSFTRKSEAALVYMCWFYEYKLGLKGRR